MLRINYINSGILSIASGYVLINCSKRYQKVKCHEDRSTTKIGIEKAIGQTHLIYLKSISEETSCDIYGKAEFLNATGSVKDRTAVSIISEAEKSGTLKPGGTIVEGTGGNTGIALAQLGASKGYKVVLFLPNSIASEKIDYQKRFGATVILQPLVPFTNPENYARKAESYASETNSLFTNQFENLANFLAHYEGTGKEIYNELDGKIDGFVTSAGTGGTIAGISSYLKDQNKDIKCYLVDPVGSVLYNYVNYNKLETTPGNSQVEGIGIGRITANFKQSQLDGAFQCTDKEAVEMAYYLMRNEGLYLGPSAALNVCGAVKLARLLGPGKVIVTILCDGGERYVSKFYNPLWLSENNLAPTRIGKSLDFVL